VGQPVVNWLRASEPGLLLVGTSTALFLSALELTSVGTALPTIVKDLEGSDFIWIGSAYGLASAAFMPASGGLSDIFGRRVIMLGSIAIFAAGSAISGAAQSMNMLIVGRSECVFFRYVEYTNLEQIYLNSNTRRRGREHHRHD